MVMAGANHRTAPVEPRERMAIAEDDVPAVIEQMKNYRALATHRNYRASCPIPALREAPSQRTPALVMNNRKRA